MQIYVTEVLQHQQGNVIRKLISGFHRAFLQSVTFII